MLQIVTRGVRRFGPGTGHIMDDQALDYFRRRELAERAAAKHATSNAARRVHQMLAEQYSERVRGA